MIVSFQDDSKDAQELFTCFMEVGLDEDVHWDGDKPDMDKACRKFKNALSDRAILGSIFAGYYPQLEDFLDREAYDEAFENFEDSAEGQYIANVVKKAYTLMVKAKND